MPQTLRKLLIDTVSVGASPNTTDMRPDTQGIADCRGWTVRAVGIEVTGGSGSPTVQIQVSPGDGDQYPPPDASYVNTATRPPGGGSYATTAIAVPTGSQVVAHLDPADYFPFVRANVTGNAGAARVRVWVEMEV